MHVYIHALKLRFDVVIWKVHFVPFYDCLFFFFFLSVLSGCPRIQAASRENKGTSTPSRGCLMKPHGCLIHRSQFQLISRAISVVLTQRTSGMKPTLLVLFIILLIGLKRGVSSSTKYQYRPKGR